MEKVRYACETPFERGGGLCRLCRAKPEDELGRRCLRLVAESRAMQALLIKASAVAETEVPVVFTGESGVGKEVVARALHANSPRQAKPFALFTCAALPPDLLEADLFGRHGLFEKTRGGTLFLDEISELPLAVQARLLRTLQTGQLRRPGEGEPVDIDVRVVCSTHQDLAAAVTRGAFRADLYYRLKVFSLRVPPLRERRDDIEPLAHMFLQQESHASGKLTREVLRAFHAYAWPGNVRELASAVKHGAVLSAGAPIALEHLPDELQSPTSFRPAPRESPFTLAELERDQILQVLEAVQGRHADAAKLLGIGRTTLWRKLKELGISRG